MIEITKTNIDLCTGCNRCVRECPMELANTVYQDDSGCIKVEPDSEKCISCGRCFSACKHEARYYEDDTERFFSDLSKGHAISIMAAPSIRTNIPDYKKIFTYLKSLGVKTIYDVSLGADICIWAHIRHMEKTNHAPLITQPCPAIVKYCETYRRELLDYLSPVHSPMCCTSIYMKEYQGITDKIAALSPCIAKPLEFNDTGLAQYNVTFSGLQKYLEKNSIRLPKAETAFDHAETGLGSLFPMPGGLKANIEYFLEGKLAIDTAEGSNVYEILDVYAQSDEHSLPHVFDVLNCDNGCNIGIAGTHSSTVFEINRSMDKNKNSVTANRDKEHFISVFASYDDALDLTRFMREYRSEAVPLPTITDEDIEKAYASLGKTEYSQQHVDCGACGSKTCSQMARKIALGVNIPTNCIVKSMEDLKTEHELKLFSDAQVATLNSILDSTPDIIFTKDLESRYTECNKSMEKHFGVRAEDIIGKNDVDALGLPQEIADKYIEMDKKVIAAKKAIVYEEYVPSQDRKLLLFETTKAPIIQDGQVIGIMAVARDVTIRKEADKRMQVLLDSSPFAAHFWDENLNVVDCNMAAVKMFNLSSKQEYMDRYFELTPEYQPCGERSVDMLRRYIDQTFEEGFLRVDWMRQTLEKEPIPVEVTLVRVEFGGKNVIAGYCRDLREHNRMMRELNRARELSELQLTKLDMVVKASKIGLWETEVDRNDPVGVQNPFIWSDDFRHMLGFTDEKDFPNIVGSFTSRLHPEDLDNTNEAFVKHIMDKTGKTPYDIEYRLMKKNGEYGYFHAMGETLRDDHGNPVYAVGAIMDITDIKNTIIETERLRNEAETANRAKSAFLSTMSHEIRTPMNVILGIAEIQLQKDNLDPDVRESLGMVYTSGDMLLGIINDILDLSKIEAGKLELIETEYEIASLVSDTAQLNMMRIGSKPIEFELSIDENLPMYVKGDELRVKQILNNLLSNAFKYTSEGTVTLSITAKPGVDDKQVTLVISVTDTGQGMTAKQVDRLFEKYTRFNEEANRATEGTGLGMNITRNLIWLMGGEISVVSEPKKGSTFTVTIPQGKPGSAVLGKKVVENLLQFRTSSRAHMKRVQITREPMPYGRVLVVDDVETNIFVAKGLLVPYDLSVESADSGFAAIGKLQSGAEYDVIFMDHMMPEMDGIETTKKIREMGYTRPIVALTANAVAGQAEMFLKNGFDDFISKPIDIRQLNTVLNKLVRDKHPPEVVEAARRRSTASKVRSHAIPESTDISPKLAALFVRDAKNSLPALDKVMDKHGSYTKDDLKRYVIYIHGLKSALANIGKKDLSALAALLEDAGREENASFIATETPPLLSSIRALIVELSPKKESEEVDAKAADLAYLREKLLLIKKSCEDLDERTAEVVVRELQHMKWPRKTEEMLTAISEFLLISEYDEAARVAGEYADGIDG